MRAAGSRSATQPFAVNGDIYGFTEPGHGVSLAGIARRPVRVPNSLRATEISAATDRGGDVALVWLANDGREEREQPSGLVQVCCVRVHAAVWSSAARRWTLSTMLTAHDDEVVAAPLVGFDASGRAVLVWQRYLQPFEFTATDPATGAHPAPAVIPGTPTGTNAQPLALATGRTTTLISQTNAYGIVRQTGASIDRLGAAEALLAPFDHYAGAAAVDARGDVALAILKGRDVYAKAAPAHRQAQEHALARGAEGITGATAVDIAADGTAIFGVVTTPPLTGGTIDLAARRPDGHWTTASEPYGSGDPALHVAAGRSGNVCASWLTMKLNVTCDLRTTSVLADGLVSSALTIDAHSARVTYVVPGRGLHERGLSPFVHALG